LSFSGTVNEADFDSVLLWYQTTLMSSPSVHLRHLKAKELLFAVFSVDGVYVHYVTMLLALCRDDVPVMGLIKAISVVTGRNVMNDRHDDDDHDHDHDDHDHRTNGKHTDKLSIKLIYEVLTVCLKNYTVIYDRFIRNVRCCLFNRTW